VHWALFYTFRKQLSPAMRGGAGKGGGEELLVFTVARIISITLGIIW